MFFFPFGKWRLRQRMLRSINTLHIIACDLFPHAGLLKVGGSYIFGETRVTLKIHQLIACAIQDAPKFGWDEQKTDSIINLLRLADGFTTVIDHSKKEELSSANIAAKYFYLICGAIGNLAFSNRKACEVRPESTLVSFDILLKDSQVDHDWHSDDLPKTLMVLNERLASLIAETQIEMNPRANQ